MPAPKPNIGSIFIKLIALIQILNLNSLEIFSDKVRNPVYVRYAWSDTSYASLFNSDGLPASSFNSENE